MVSIMKPAIPMITNRKRKLSQVGKPPMSRLTLNDVTAQTSQNSSHRPKIKMVGVIERLDLAPLMPSRFGRARGGVAAWPGDVRPGFSAMLADPTLAFTHQAPHRAEADLDVSCPYLSDNVSRIHNLTI